MEAKANPTFETQQKIIEIIENTDRPLSITAVSKLSKVGFNEVKTTINFLVGLGFVETIVSSGNVRLVLPKKKVDKNED